MSGSERSDWAPRTLSVVTGHTRSWQTALWNQIWFNVVERYEVDLTDEERAAADAWINDLFFWCTRPTGRR